MKKLFYLLPLLAAGLQIHAQQGLTNFGRLQVHGGSVLVSGTLNNKSQGILVNNGQLIAKGNLRNDQAAMASGNGTLTLNGTSTQQIAGTQPWRTHHLNTQNGAGINMAANLEVAGQHQFLSGIISTTGSSYVLYRNGATHTGSADNRHVAGLVRKQGATDFTFPVGNGTLLRPVQISSMQEASTFEVRYRQNTPFASQLQNGLVAVATAEYWEVQTIAGGSAAISLAWDHAKVAMPDWGLAEVRVAQLGGTSWTDAGGSATGNMLTQGSISSSLMTLSGMYTFGQKSVPLPLTLVSFGAKRAGNSTWLDWQTVAESGVQRFAVERSDDGRQFAEIGTLPARNRSGAEHYQWEDASPIGSVAYYRLRCIDIDGKIKMSAVVAVSSAVANNLSLVTNPVRQTAQIRIPQGISGQVHYAITSASGQLVQQGNIALQGGSIASLSLGQQVLPGVYFLKLYTASQSHTLRFVRE